VSEGETKRQREGVVRKTRGRIVSQLLVTSYELREKPEEDKAS